MARICSCLLVAVLLVSGCSEPPLQALPPEGIILAFGDSLTAGVGAGTARSYPHVLAELSGRQVINAGLAGETTSEGLARLPEVIAETNPDLLILLEGGNDILRKRQAAETRRNLAAMIELALARDIPVVLLGVPDKVLFSNAAPFYTELADEYPVVFDGTLLAGLLRTPGYKADPVHLNATGYRELAKGLHRLLTESGAL